MCKAIRLPVFPNIINGPFPRYTHVYKNSGSISKVKKDLVLVELNKKINNNKKKTNENKMSLEFKVTGFV